MAFVIMLAVVLVASVVSLVSSIDLTIYTLYGYNRYLTGLTPRNTLSLDAGELAKAHALPGVGAICATHSYSVRAKTIFGKMVFPIFGLDADGRSVLMSRCGVHVVAGRMPVDGAPEAILSDDVAKNLSVKLGDVLLKPESEDNYAPAPVKLVGLLHGPVWLGITSRALVDSNSPFTWSGALIFAKSTSVAAQRKLDDELEHAVDKSSTRVWRYSGLVNETKSSLSNLYLILDIVIGIIVFAISFVCGLLANIYFTQRLPEIATLSAIGYSRGFLIRRAFWETAVLCTVGWLLGIGATAGLLSMLRAVALSPKGLLLETVNLTAFAWTLPLPITITLFAVGTIAIRLSRLDPVSIIERR